MNSSWISLSARIVSREEVIPEARLITTASTIGLEEEAEEGIGLHQEAEETDLRNSSEITCCSLDVEFKRRKSKRIQNGLISQ